MGFFVLAIGRQLGQSKKDRCGCGTRSDPLRSEREYLEIFFKIGEAAAAAKALKIGRR